MPKGFKREGGPTPAFKRWLIARHSREIVPNPFEHFFALLNTRKGRRKDFREGFELRSLEGRVGSHVAWYTSDEIPRRSRGTAPWLSWMLKWNIFLTRTNDKNVSELKLNLLRFCHCFEMGQWYRISLERLIRYFISKAPAMIVKQDTSAYDAPLRPGYDY